MSARTEIARAELSSRTSGATRARRPISALRRRMRPVPLALCLCLGLGGASYVGLGPASAQAAPARKSRRPPIVHTLDLVDTAGRYVEVRIEVPKPKGRTTTFAMPAWAPGSYLIRDFGRHVYDLRAEAPGGLELPTQRLDKQRWEVEHKGKSFTLRYRVYADELSVRTSYVDDRMALLNGTSVFMYLEDDPGHPQAYPIDLRVGERPAGWGVHTALEDAGGHWLAPSYDALADAPLLLGEARVERFVVDGVDFEYVYVAPGGSNADVARLARDAEAIVRAFGEMMGGFPFSHYRFLVVGDPAGGGGLEHKNSTAMVLRPWSFTNDDAYRNAAGLAAHEFFHAWNVKRIRDAKLGPFDYAKEVYTDLLWFHEGFTNAMEARAMLRAKINTPEQYLQDLAKNFGAYDERPGSDHTPVSQLSRDAWIKAYQSSPNHWNTSISYYLKGELIGVALDLELRRRAASRGREGSLEGLFRRLWSERPAARGKDPNAAGADEVLISRADVVRAASAEAGEDMSKFFTDYVDGTREIPLPKLLEAFAIEANTGDEAKVDGASKTDDAPPSPRGWTGLHGGDEISAIDANSPAARAGLATGDQPIALDGARIDGVDELRSRAEALAPGTRVRVDYFRRGRLDRRVMTVGTDPTRSWSFAPRASDAATAEALQLRNAWLPGLAVAETQAALETTTSAARPSAKTSTEATATTTIPATPSGD